MMEGRSSVQLYSENPSLLNCIDISSRNFTALSESHFIVKFQYTVKDNRNPTNTHDYQHWIILTSPAFSWVRNISIELNNQKVTQNTNAFDIQPVQHVLSLMERSIGTLKYPDNDLFGESTPAELCVWTNHFSFTC